MLGFTGGRDGSGVACRRWPAAVGTCRRRRGGSLFTPSSRNRIRALTGAPPRPNELSIREDPAVAPASPAPHRPQCTGRAWCPGPWRPILHTPRYTSSGGNGWTQTQQRHNTETTDTRTNHKWEAAEDPNPSPVPIQSPIQSPRSNSRMRITSNLHGVSIPSGRRVTWPVVVRRLAGMAIEREREREQQ